MSSPHPNVSNVFERGSTSYSSRSTQPRLNREAWTNPEFSGYQDLTSGSSWTGSPAHASAPTHYQNQSHMSPVGEQPSGSAYAPQWSGSWPPPLLRRTSSEEAPRLSQLAGSYYGSDVSSSVPSLSKSYSQRRPSNRDEFDGPSQLLSKPEDGGYEPKEEDLPPLPVTLYAQEQDDILSKVNDRLSQCAFDFVARYQFPIPIENDKRPVRVPSDREWSEWVYLLKRLATKRRIPARVLYNGQIKQLITILENSLEMRHAAKHQSRPLKDDRNILQLISSGLQVAKILKDAPAMQYLDSLYIQTERLIQGRRAKAQPSIGTLSII